MNRNRFLVLCLISVLLCVRFAGLHLHGHLHSATHDEGVPETVHLADKFEHGGEPHSQDVDLGFLDVTFGKLSGLDFDPALAPFALLLCLLSLVFLTILDRPRPAAPVWAIVRHRLPLATAPPR